MSESETGMCTYRRNGKGDTCGKAKSALIHVKPHEPMSPGRHVWQRDRIR